jgi:hypothetical protein
MANPIPKGNSFAAIYDCGVSKSLTKDTSAVPVVAFDGLRVLV